MTCKKACYSFLFLFFILIFSIPVFWIVRGKVESVRSPIEGKYLEDFPGIKVKNLSIALQHLSNGKLEKAGNVFFNQFLDRTYQSKFEEAAADQAPFRILAINTSKGIDRQIIQMAYAPFDDPMIPAAINSDLFVSRDNMVLDSVPKLFTKSKKNIIDQRIENYNLIISEHPEVNFYLFYLERIHYSKFHPLVNDYHLADRGQSFEYFLARKPENLNLATMMLSSYQDRLDYFYRTDHHWNIRGLLKGYEIIYAQLAENYPDISPMLQHDELVTFEDIKFYGSLAREVFYPIEGDAFEVARINFPDYEVIEDGDTFDADKREEYFAGNYSRDKYTSHYADFFGRDYGLLEFRFENDSDRNLLIIGHSFANPLEPMLASHYHTTYSVDFRHIEDFSLTEFLSTHPVDDILIIGDNDVAFESKSWTINP